MILPQFSVVADDIKIFLEMNVTVLKIYKMMSFCCFSAWATKRQLQFNTSKYKLLHFGHSNPYFTYHMNHDNIILERI